MYIIHLYLTIYKISETFDEKFYYLTGDSYSGINFNFFLYKNILLNLRVSNKATSTITLNEWTTIVKINRLQYHTTQIDFKILNNSSGKINARLIIADNGDKSAIAVTGTFAANVYTEQDILMCLH